MVTDIQVRRLKKLSNIERNQEIAASKAGMDPKTARKYLKENRLPSELKRERHWRTREDPFSDVWERVRQQIEESPGLEAKTLFVFTFDLYIGLVRAVAFIRRLQMRTAAFVQFRCVGLHPAPDATGVNFHAALRQKFRDVPVGEGIA